MWKPELKPHPKAIKKNESEALYICTCARVICNTTRDTLSLRPLAVKKFGPMLRHVRTYTTYPISVINLPFNTMRHIVHIVTTVGSLSRVWYLVLVYRNKEGTTFYH